MYKYLLLLLPFSLFAQDAPHIKSLQELCAQTVIAHAIQIPPDFPEMIYTTQISPALCSVQKKSKAAIERIISRPNTESRDPFIQEENAIFYRGGPWDNDCRASVCRQIASFLYKNNCQDVCMGISCFMGIICAASGIVGVAMLPDDASWSQALQRGSLTPFGIALCFSICCSDYGQLCRYALKCATRSNNHTERNALLPQATRDAYQRQQQLIIQDADDASSSDHASSSSDDETVLLLG